MSMSIDIGYITTCNEDSNTYAHSSSCKMYYTCEQVNKKISPMYITVYNT